MVPRFERRESVLSYQTDTCESATLSPVDVQYDAVRNVFWRPGRYVLQVCSQRRHDYDDPNWLDTCRSHSR